jgi:hypothetical protein
MRFNYVKWAGENTMVSFRGRVVTPKVHWGENRSTQNHFLQPPISEVDGIITF